MNVDPSSIGIRQYSALVHGWNADPDGSAAPRDYSRLRRAMDAHTVH
jgi:hypothetical protein